MQESMCYVCMFSMCLCMCVCVCVYVRVRACLSVCLSVCMYVSINTTIQVMIAYVDCYMAAALHNAIWSVTCVCIANITSLHHVIVQYPISLALTDRTLDQY